jgi:uncharacterized protein
MNPQLTPVQARVIATLVEKSISTPEYYPLTTNSLVNACNQKSQRAPQMQLTEGEVGGALRDFEAMDWVKRDDSARATKWRQQFQHQMLLKREVQAVLVTLMLRGPQTVAELRGNAAYIGGPDDAAGVQAALDDLLDRADPLVMELPRQPGQAATRWAHLLCGEPDVPATVSSPAAPVSRAERSDLEARVAALEARLAALEAQLGV